MSHLTTLHTFLSQILDDGQSPKHTPSQNRAAHEWSVQQVSHWLMSLNLDQYVSEFSAQNISGEQLLQLDGNKLKVKDSSSVLVTRYVYYAAPDMVSSAESVLHIYVVVFVSTYQKRY